MVWKKEIEQTFRNHFRQRHVNKLQDDQANESKRGQTGGEQLLEEDEDGCSSEQDGHQRQHDEEVLRKAGQDIPHHPPSCQGHPQLHPLLHLPACRRICLGS